MNIVFLWKHPKASLYTNIAQEINRLQRHASEKHGSFYDIRLILMTYSADIAVQVRNTELKYFCPLYNRFNDREKGREECPRAVYIWSMSFKSN